MCVINNCPLYDKSKVRFVTICEIYKFIPILEYSYVSGYFPNSFVRTSSVLSLIIAPSCLYPAAKAFMDADDPL